ncbi:hypothetical protein LXL04_007368 [Taraxacum kok-saghyz]
MNIASFSPTLLKSHGSSLPSAKMITMNRITSSSLSPPPVKTSRIEKNQSTVFRTYVPPSFPLFLANPNVVAVLDCKSFAHMFDMELVDKKNILVCDFMPSTKFTGDRRVCAYLDTTEPQHEQQIYQHTAITFHVPIIANRRDRNYLAGWKVTPSQRSVYVKQKAVVLSSLQHSMIDHWS